MLPENSAGRRPPLGRACLIVADRRGLSEWAEAEIASRRQHGATIHLLYCGKDRTPPLSIPHTRLDEIAFPPQTMLKSIEPQGPPDHAELVRAALELLQKQHEFQSFHFGLRGGLGFRTLQAKQAGLAFHGVPLVLHLDSCSQRDREAKEAWPGDLDDLYTDYMERYSFEHVDERRAASRETAEYIDKQSWQARIRDSHDADASNPLVTIGVAYYNLGAYLPETLKSIHEQTYGNLEVIVVDDGSTDEESISQFDEMKNIYPRFRFLRQANAGIGATRNWCLAEAQGKYFIPMDADNIARPEMVEKFVRAIEINDSLSAMTCYFLAFSDCRPGICPDRFLYAGRPTGGPHALAAIRNVYGDANGIFRTEDFRSIGGYEPDRGASCEDWEAYVKLVHSGKRIGIVPAPLFYYRHRAAGFSRATNWFANHQRVMRQFQRMDSLPPGEAAAVWSALLGFQRRVAQLEENQSRRRYRVADRVHRCLSRCLPSCWFG